MSEVQIKSVSVKHDAIMDYMLSNPAAPLSQVAIQFGISQAWLSVIIHSDAFQAQLDVKKSGVFAAVVIPLREKLVGIAHLSVEKLGEVLENSSTITDKQFIADTTDSILKNLGYSPKGGVASSGNTQNNTFIVHVDKDTLAAARETMRVVKESQAVTIEHDKDITSDEV